MKHRIQNLESRIQKVAIRLVAPAAERGYDPKQERVATESRSRHGAHGVHALPAAAGKGGLAHGLMWEKAVANRGFYRIIYRLFPDKWRGQPALPAYSRLFPHKFFFAAQTQPNFGQGNDRQGNKETRNSNPEVSLESFRVEFIMETNSEQRRRARGRRSKEDPGNANSWHLSNCQCVWGGIIFTHDKHPG